MEIRKSLVLSTAHLTPEIAAALDAGTFSVQISWEYGWEAYAGEDITDDDLDVSCINAAFALAREHGCTWVVYDCDGPIVDALPIYSW